MGKIFTFKNKRRMPRFLGYILTGILRLYAKTLRLTLDLADGKLPDLEHTPQIFVMWHNRSVFMLPLFPKELRHFISVLVSGSRDGEYIATLIKCIGGNVVRGSSSKGGTSAMVYLMASLKNNFSPLITVDGPRGPMYTVHPGAAQLARLTHVPITPITLNSSRHWSLKSWDRMQIPYPFSRMTIKIGHPRMISEGMSVEEGNRIVKAALDEITRDCPGSTNT